MKTWKKIFVWTVSLISALLGIIVIPCTGIMELLASKYVGRLFYRLDVWGYRFWKYVSPETVYILGKPDLDSKLKELSEFRSQCRSFRQQYINWIKLVYMAFISKWHEHDDRKLLISMDINSNNPFYEETFKFLKNYFGFYHIPPGIIPIDQHGIMYLKIEVLERTKDDLTIEELQKSLHIRLINVLMKSEYLIDIPLGYWSTSTIYFPDLEKNLENDCLVVMLALSKAGSDYIISLRREENNISCVDLEETL